MKDLERALEMHRLMEQWVKDGADEFEIMGILSFTLFSMQSELKNTMEPEKLLEATTLLKAFKSEKH